MVHIELIYIATDLNTLHIHLDMEQGSTVMDAINQSGVSVVHPETQDLPVGIYAKRVSRDTVLNDGDRVEIYRPLTLDPKEKRRRLARLKK